MRALLLALLLGLTTMAEARADGSGNTPAECQDMLEKLDARLKVVRLTKEAYDKVLLLAAEGRAAIESGGDCGTPLKAALRKLGVH
jgi:hypothetical protein